MKQASEYLSVRQLVTLASKFQKFAGGSCPQPPPVLHVYEVMHAETRPAQWVTLHNIQACFIKEVWFAKLIVHAYWHAHIYVTPLLKILATCLFCC